MGASDGAVALKAKPLPINTFQENLLVLSRCNRALRPERLLGARRVEVTACRHSQDGGRTLADGEIMPNVAEVDERVLLYCAGLLADALRDEVI